ncbi:MAG TPA: DUF4142 domain-containing protein [Longimicrobiales bacterium]
MQRAWLAGLTLAGLMAGAGCTKANNAATASSDTAMASPAAPAAESSAAAPASAALSDPQIAMIALSANSGDSARGRLAEQKATNAEVKAFGKMMVTDHGGLNKQAVALAKKLNVTPAQSAADSDLVSKVQGMTADLQGKTGKDFDKTYVDQEVQIHQLVLDDLDKTLIPAAQNAELKSLLQTARGGVQAHLQKAQALQAKLK